jgi:dipeptidyl aminopeptidase/acylaminoacyl peptidase
VSWPSSQRCNRVADCRRCIGGSIGPSTFGERRREVRRTNLCGVIITVGLVAACGGQPASTFSPSGLGACDSDSAVVAAFLGGTTGGGRFPSDAVGSPSGSDVWVISASGGVRRVTDGLNSLSPWLSTDGRTLYFVRSSGGIEAGAPASGTAGWRLDLDSGEETLLVRGRSIDGLIASPDGRLIAYSSNAEDATDFTPTIKIADVAAPDYPIVTIEGNPPRRYLTAQTAPAFSPDGRLLAYVSLISSPANDQTTMVRLVDLKTGEDSLLYTAPPEETLLGLEWLADQSRLLAVRNHHRATAASIDPTTGQADEIDADVTLTVEWAAADGSAVSGIGVPPEDWERAPDEIDLVYMTWADGRRIDLELPESLAYAHDLTIADCAYLDGD